MNENLRQVLEELAKKMGEKPGAEIATNQEPDELVYHSTTRSLIKRQLEHQKAKERFVRKCETTECNDHMKTARKHLLEESIAGTP